MAVVPPMILRFLLISAPLSLFCVKKPRATATPTIPRIPIPNNTLTVVLDSIYLLDDNSDTKLFTVISPLGHSKAQSGIVNTTKSINSNRTKNRIGIIRCQNDDIFNSFVRVSFVPISIVD